MVTDITIYETFDGGDLYNTGSDLAAVSGLGNQAYLALFGGESEWFGNSHIESEENQFSSQTEITLREVVLNIQGVLSIENAVKNDLKFLKEYADISIEVILLGGAKCKIEVELKEPDKDSEKLEFIWDAQKQETIWTLQQ